MCRRARAGPGTGTRRGAAGDCPGEVIRGNRMSPEGPRGRGVRRGSVCRLSPPGRAGCPGGGSPGGGHGPVQVSESSPRGTAFRRVIITFSAPQVTQNENQSPGCAATAVCHCATSQAGRRGLGAALRGQEPRPCARPLAPRPIALTSGLGRSSSQSALFCSLVIKSCAGQIGWGEGKGGCR